MRLLSFSIMPLDLAVEKYNEDFLRKMLSESPDEELYFFEAKAEIDGERYDWAFTEVIDKANMMREIAVKAFNRSAAVAGISERFGPRFEFEVIKK